jgi:hypothetical protein
MEVMLSCCLAAAAAAAGVLQFLIGAGLAVIFWTTGIVKKPKLDAATVSTQHIQQQGAATAAGHSTCSSSCSHGVPTAGRMAGSTAAAGATHSTKQLWQLQV